MSNAIDINDNSFKEEVIDSDRLTIVDFWAPWCGPCRKLGPVLDEVVSEYSEKIKVVKLNTDENLKTAGKLVYAPVYLVMFIEKNTDAPSYYKVDISGILQSV